MIKEIQAKSLLSKVPQPDTWFGLTYTINLYRGCQHQCIYCDSRSECYGIENFSDVLVKINAIDLLQKALAGRRRKGTIGTGSMNDPYMPLEAKLNLTGRALEVMAHHGFPVHVITKSDLVLKDLPTLAAISRVYAAVSFSISTADDDLAKKLEPGAPPPSARFRAMAALAQAGILTGVTMMPILPFLCDTEANITQIVSQAAASGAGYIIPWFGMTLRDRQRSYYYHQLDRHFPGLRQQYETTFGGQYQCNAPNAARLHQLCQELCQRHGIAPRMPRYSPPVAAVQPRLF